MKNIVITGATGYLGSNLVKFLHENKQYNIFGTARRTSDIAKIKDYCNIFYTDELEKCFKDNKIDIIIHLATNSINLLELNNYQEMINDNISFGVEILNLMQKYGVKNMINVSTYFQNTTSTIEYSPANFYAATKQAFEDITRYFIEKEGFKIVTLVLYDVYGPNDKRRKILNILLEAIKRGDTSFDMTAGEQTVHFVHIDDVVLAFETTINCMFNGMIDCDKFYIANPQNNITLKNVVETLLQVSGTSMKVNFGGIPYPEGVVIKPFIGKTLPGWNSQISFKKAIHQLILNL